MPSKKDFPATPSEEREFTVHGQTFHYLNLSPEQAFANGDFPEDAGPWDISDIQTLRHLPENEHEAWKALRQDKENPLTIKELNSIYAWLWEEATGIPLPQAELLESGVGKTATSSSVKSPSTAGSRKK